MTSEQTQKTPWSKLLDMEQVEDGLFSLNFPLDFCIGTRAHGGTLNSLYMRAARLYFQDSSRRPILPDVVDIKVNYFGMVEEGPMSIKIEDQAISKRSATIIAHVFQEDAATSVALITMGDLSRKTGASFETHWQLDPEPLPANVAKLTRDDDPNWISYQHCWHPTAYMRILSHVKFWVPLRRHANPTIRDEWLSPVDDHTESKFGWTNDHLGYLSDILLPPLEEWQGRHGVGSHENAIAVAKLQKADRDAGRPLTDYSDGISPYFHYTTTFDMDIKKRLPTEGAKWIFGRVNSKQAKHGRMDWDITLHDESMDLLATIHGRHQIVSTQMAPMPNETRAETGKSKL